MKYRGEFEHIVYTTSTDIIIDDQDFIIDLFSIEQDDDSTETYELKLTIDFLLYQIEFLNFCIVGVLLNDQERSIDSDKLSMVYQYIIENFNQIITEKYDELKNQIDYSLHRIYKNI